MSEGCSTTSQLVLYAQPASHTALSTLISFVMSIDYELEWRLVDLRSLRLPSIRSNAAGAIMNQELVIFGGKGSNQFNEIWKFSSTKLLWEVIDARGEDIPLPRDGHTLTKISETEFYIFGGQGHVMGTKVYEKQTENGKAKCLSIRKLFDDIYSFNSETLTWSPYPRRKITPQGRRGHSMLFISSNLLSKSSFISEHGPILSSGKGYLLLFGGSCVDLNCSVEKSNNDMWLFSLETSEWEQVLYQGPSPLPLYGHCAEMIDHFMVVVGGNLATPAARRGSQGLPMNSEWNYLSQTNHNSVSIFNLLTLQWSHLTISSNSQPNPNPRMGLNLLGHSIVRSPLEKNEIWIFGGRRADELNLSEEEIVRVRSLPAPILSLNLQTGELFPLQFLSSSSSSPEARLNQVFLRLSDVNIDLSIPPPNQDQQAFGKVVPSPLQPQSLIRLYGGSKLYSSGYCGGDVYELHFIPSPPSDSPTRLAPSSEQEASPVTAAAAETSFVSSPLFRRQQSLASLNRSLCSLDGGGSDDDSSLASGISSSELGPTHGPGGTGHRLKLKEDSSVRLLAPKTGIEGKYFLLKTELSHSKSTFTTDREPTLQTQQHLLLPKLSQKSSRNGLPSSASTSSLSPLRNNTRKDRLSPLDLHSPADFSPNTSVSSPHRKRSPKKHLKSQHSAATVNHLSPISRGAAPTL